MYQQQQTGKASNGTFETSSRKLNKSAAPIKNVTKNTMKMKSKAFKASRRTENSMTNMSQKAVSKKTSGIRGAGKSIGKKSYKAKSVTQVNPQQIAQPGVRALSRTASMQPQNAHVKAKKSPSLPRTYASTMKSVRKTMGYS